MARILRWAVLVAAAMFASAAVAQSGPEYEQRRSRAIFAQPELDQMLAPIALYPDALLSQILMAATYPQDLAEAASWSRANGGMRGDQAVRAVEQEEDWDPSVMSLVAFPQVLAMMDERRGWTERLGAAFLDQSDQVMDTVQHLRRRADAAGSLRTSEEIIIQRQGNDYVIEPPSPEMVYVPYYDPRVAYGNWWWPEYQPVYWNPWPGYGYRDGYHRGFGWGYGISLGSGFFFGSFDWPRRYLRYSSHRPWYHHGHSYRGGTRWTHGHDYRRDREGRNPSGRTGERDRDNRWRDRDGRPDRRDARTPDRRDGRTGERHTSTPTPTTQGFFPPRMETPVARAESIAPRQAASKNPALRTVAPRYSNESAPRGGRIQAPAAQQQQAQPQAYVPAQRAARPRQAPAVQAAPVERSSPVQRAFPAERATREDRPERASPAERSSPAERGGGRAGRER